VSQFCIISRLYALIQGSLETPLCASLRSMIPKSSLAYLSYSILLTSSHRDMPFLSFFLPFRFLSRVEMECNALVTKMEWFLKNRLSSPVIRRCHYNFVTNVCIETHTCMYIVRRRVIALPFSSRLVPRRRRWALRPRKV
jgi:hypothetical protein